jgi:hypothetical protein
VRVDPSILLLLAFPPLFLAVWFLSMHLIAAVGGWRELARVYRADGPITVAAQWRNRYGRLRYGTGYNGCLNIAANEIGMQISLWRIFRPAHPPLFIPWSDIATEPVRGVFVESTRFSFRRATTTLLLKRTLADEILRAGHRGVPSPAWEPPRSSSFSL